MMLPMDRLGLAEGSLETNRSGGANSPAAETETGFDALLEQLAGVMAVASPPLAGEPPDPLQAGASRSTPQGAPASRAFPALGDPQAISASPAEPQALEVPAEQERKALSLPTAAGGRATTRGELEPMAQLDRSAASERTALLPAVSAGPSLGAAPVPPERAASPTAAWPAKGQPSSAVRASIPVGESAAPAEVAARPVLERPLGREMVEALGSAEERAAAATAREAAGEALSRGSDSFGGAPVPSREAVQGVGVGGGLPPIVLPEQPAAGAGRVEVAIPAQISWLASRGGGSARVVLHPVELGQVEVAVRVRGDAVEVELRAVEPAARTALLEVREQLGDSLEAKNLRVESLEVRGVDSRSEGTLDSRGDTAGSRDPNVMGEDRGRGQDGSADDAEGTRRLADADPSDGTPHETDKTESLGALARPGLDLHL